MGLISRACLGLATMLIVSMMTEGYIQHPTFRKSVSSSRTFLGVTEARDASTFSSSEEKKRIKSVGGGTPLIDAGNKQLFDPDLEGKLQGTGVLSERIARGSDFDISSFLNPKEEEERAPPADVQMFEAQNWLEHLDTNLPLNFAKPKNPVEATILGRRRIITPDAPGDIQHIILRLPPGMHYVEGQSLSIIPPGIDPNTNRPYAPRLYSIASTRYGDLLDGTTASLCVRRAVYYDPIASVEDPTKKGVCSNFLCDSQPGQRVKIAGPVGKTMLLPEKEDVDLIMIATGTGIAPFRGFMHRLFMERTVKGHMYGGKAWLVLGVPTTGGLLYKEEIDAMLSSSPDRLKVDYAISREMTNPFDNGKLYVQHVIAQNADEFFDKLDSGAHVYFCGLKGMMPPILETLEDVAKARGLDWGEKLKVLKKNDQWHVEVY